MATMERVRGIVKEVDGKKFVLNSGVTYWRGQEFPEVSVGDSLEFDSNPWSSTSGEVRNYANPLGSRGERKQYAEKKFGGSGGGYTKKEYKERYADKEEVFLRTQRNIVRQSSLTKAVDMVSAYGKDLSMVSAKKEVMRLAEEFENWVNRE